MINENVRAEWENTARTHKDMRMHYHLVMCPDENTGLTYIHRYLTQLTDEHRKYFAGLDLKTDQFDGVTPVVTVITTVAHIEHAPRPGTDDMAPSSLTSLYLLGADTWSPEFRQAAEQYILRHRPNIFIHQPIKLAA